MLKTLSGNKCRCRICILFFVLFIAELYSSLASLKRNKFPNTIATLFIYNVLAEYSTPKEFVNRDQ